MQSRLNDTVTEAAYHRQREAEECELAAAATDEASRRHHFALAERHAAMMEEAQGLRARLARRLPLRPRPWMLASVR
ncbi:MAG: hypothetical protein JWN66_4067 [Sphingomonas bacterium]|jgi:hypothetical protein|uniref:hypothetical protein n=1 Tax=Sphingomonas bacterium TaxID=1895847 RepID=UPI002613E394|nr:hypothetical protein [Sphingomonas bacterium]MDB5706951.1 hypothetical protein [Sphingomonas bacterium]